MSLNEQPSAKTVAATLRDIEAAELPLGHPRAIARRLLKRWRSDATRLKLAVSNQHDSGAPSLRVDEVLGHEGHDARLGRK